MPTKENRNLAYTWLLDHKAPASEPYGGRHGTYFEFWRSGHFVCAADANTAVFNLQRILAVDLCADFTAARPRSILHIEDKVNHGERYLISQNTLLAATRGQQEQVVRVFEDLRFLAHLNLDFLLKLPVALGCLTHQTARADFVDTHMSVGHHDIWPNTDAVWIASLQLPQMPANRIARWFHTQLFGDAADGPTAAIAQAVGGELIESCSYERPTPDQLVFHFGEAPANRVLIAAQCRLACNYSFG